MSLLKEKLLRCLSVTGLALLTGCVPAEQQVKKIVDLGEIEITQLSPHLYKVYTQLAWPWQKEPAWHRAIDFLRERCNIEHIQGGKDYNLTLVVVEEPNCVKELR